MNIKYFRILLSPFQINQNYFHVVQWRLQSFCATHCWPSYFKFFYPRINLNNSFFFLYCYIMHVKVNISNRDIHSYICCILYFRAFNFGAACVTGTNSRCPLFSLYSCFFSVFRVLLLHKRYKTFLSANECFTLNIENTSNISFYYFNVPLFVFNDVNRVTYIPRGCRLYENFIIIF